MARQREKWSQAKGEVTKLTQKKGGRDGGEVKPGRRWNCEKSHAKNQKEKKGQGTKAKTEHEGTTEWGRKKESKTDKQRKRDQIADEEG